jgi:folate-binding protein YgfZ
MSLTPHPSLTGASFTLSSPTLLLIEGADVGSFLNRLLTIKTASWEVGEGGPAHMLEHTGKIKASLYLLRFGERQWLAQSLQRVGSDDAPSLTELLDLYLFGEDVRFTPLEGWQSLELSAPLEVKEALGQALSLPQLSNAPSQAWRVLSPLSTTLSSLSLSEPQAHPAWALTPVWAPYSEHLISLSAFGRSEVIAQLVTTLSSFGLQKLSAAEWSAQRVALGAPAHGYEYSSRVTPLDIEPPNALISITEGKGCYPGQEVIERTLALGRASRQLVRLERDGAPLSDEQQTAGKAASPLSLPLFNTAAPESAPVGELTSLSPTHHLPYALALIKRSAVALKQDPHARLTVGGEGPLSGLCFKFDDVCALHDMEHSDEQ